MRLVLDRTFLELYIDMSSVMFMNGSVITSTVFRLRSQINVTDYNMSLISNLFGVFLDSGFFVDNSSISRTRTLLSLFVRSFGVASTAVLTPFLANANVNSRSRSLYAIAVPSVFCRLSSVCLSSVTLVHPTQLVEIFGQFFFAVWYRGHPLTSTENFT